MKNALGVIGAAVLLAGVWYMAGLRAENRTLREQIAEYESEAAGARTTPGRSAEVQAADSQPRMLTDDARNVLIDGLSASTGNKVWFVTQRNDREAESFQREIEDAFLEAGWEIASSSQSTAFLRQGLRIFVADDVIPEHVSAAVSSLRATGFDVFTGTGYRDFYAKQKEKNPDFSGIELAADQDFVIVVGPKPSAP